MNPSINLNAGPAVESSSSKEEEDHVLTNKLAGFASIVRPDEIDDIRNMYEIPSSFV